MSIEWEKDSSPLWEVEKYPGYLKTRGGINWDWFDFDTKEHAEAFAVDCRKKGYRADIQNDTTVHAHAYQD